MPGDEKQVRHRGAEHFGTTPVSTPAVGFIGLGNMGSAMATRLLEAGFDVTVYNRSPGKSDALAARGATVVVCAGDVRDTAFMAKSAADFIAAAGGVDLVIANAGVGLADTVRTGDAAGVAWLMEVNVIGVTNTVLPFVPTMLAQRSGVLCAVSSFAGHRAVPGRSAYSASKAAVIMESI
jgi:NADP-dependent 3-hydroxy acid dehydrogenase YdfG